MRETPVRMVIRNSKEIPLPIRGLDRIGTAKVHMEQFTNFGRSVTIMRIGVLRALADDARNTMLLIKRTGVMSHNLVTILH
jgi:hypothetical protein